MQKLVTDSEISLILPPQTFSIPRKLLLLCRQMGITFRKP